VKDYVAYILRVKVSHLVVDLKNKYMRRHKTVFGTRKIAIFYVLSNQNAAIQALKIKSTPSSSIKVAHFEPK
jgi:hypothetical protein